MIVDLFTGLELEKVVFGTEEEALSELNHFIPAVKV